MDSTRSKTLSVTAILAAAEPPQEGPSSVMHHRHCSSSSFPYSVSFLLISVDLLVFFFFFIN